MPRLDVRTLIDVAHFAQRRGLEVALDADLDLVLDSLGVSLAVQAAVRQALRSRPEACLRDLTSEICEQTLRRLLSQRELVHLKNSLIVALPELADAVLFEQQAAAAAVVSAGARADGLAAHMTKAALAAWAHQHGAADLLVLALAELTDLKNDQLRWYFGDATVGEILTTRPHSYYVRHAGEAQRLCMTHLRQRAAEAQQSLAVSAAKRAARTQPDHRKVAAFFNKIDGVRLVMRGVAPSLSMGDSAVRIAILDEPFGVELTLTRPAKDGCVANPRVGILIRDRGAPLVSCDCEEETAREPGFVCRSQVDALEVMLDLLGTPQAGQAQEIVEALTAQLDVPVATRQARRYLRALGLEEAPSPRLDGVAATPVWRLHQDGARWRLSPGLARPKKTGAGVVVRAWAVEAAQHWLEQRGEPRDQHLLALTGSLSDLAHVTWVNTDVAEGRLQDQLLALMVGHPALYAAKGAALQLEVRRAEVTLRLDHVGKTAEMRAYIGEKLACEVLDRGQIESLHFGDLLLWDPNDADAVVLHASQRAHVGLMLETRGKHRFAASALPELRSKLMPLAQSGEVVFSTQVRGDAVAAGTEPMVELAFDGGALRVALRIAPLPGGALAEPGEGPSVWYAMQESAPVYCERDRHAERAAAKALWLQLDAVVQASNEAERQGAGDGDSDADGDGRGWFLAAEDAPEEGESRWCTYVSQLDTALDLVAWLRRAADFAAQTPDAPPADAARDADGGDVSEPNLVPERWRGLTVRWDSEPVRLLGQATASNLKVQVDAGRDWFGVRASMAVDGVIVPLDQLLDAARDARRYVQVDGHGWLRMEAGLRRRLSALTHDGAGLSPLAAPVLMALQDEGAQIDGPQQWLQIADRIRSAAALVPEVPTTLNAELRPYQHGGFAWLARLSMWAPGAVLADDMGLGKTVQALALLLRRAAQGPALVVAPTSLGFNWLREAARFSPGLEMRALRGQADVAVLDDLGANVVVVTSWDVAVLQLKRLGETTWTTLVMDEAQAIKNPATRRAKAIFALDADFRLALTGTPMENHTGELWSIFRAAVPGLLGPHKRFRERFQVPIERDGDERAKAALAALISPFLLRRLKSEVAQDLPARTDVLVEVELSKPERRRYEQLRASTAAELAKPTSPEDRDQGRRFRVLAALTRLRQLSCHPGLFDPTYDGTSAKLEELRRRLDELRSEGHRALVFSQFTSLLDLVRPVLEADGARILQLDGRTPAGKRRALVEAFQAGEADVFLLSIKAGGTGLNLTAASYVFHLDPWWNPAVEDQATDRAHRIGQEQQVTVYRLVARATVEESIYALHDDKRALTDALLSGATKTGPMAVEDLEALLLGGGS